MKDLKHSTRPEPRSPICSVSLKVRDYQVTVKVKSAVPQTSTPRAVYPAFR